MEKNSYERRAHEPIYGYISKMNGKQNSGS